MMSLRSNGCRHTYPQWSAVDMNAYMGDALDEQGVDLLLSMLRYNPDERISVRCLHVVL